MWTFTHCQFTIFLIVLFGNNVTPQHEGGTCTHKTKGVSGICKRLERCPIAIQDMGKGVFPQNCSFVDTAVTVCCPSEATATTATVKPMSSILPVGEKCRRECERHKHLAYKKEINPTPFDDDYDLVENCPWEDKSLTVVYDGEKCKEAEFPHMALIGYGTWPDNYDWKCGGSLISDKYVLTAAHCLYARGFGEPKFIRLGDLDYNTTEDDKYMQQISIRKIIRHPLYKFPARYHDIALLELEEPVQPNLHVKPGCLYTENPSKNVGSGIITGWGATERGKPSTALLKGTIRYFTAETCNETFSNDLRLPRGIDPELQICFGPYRNQMDTCQGDSGGPIQIYNKDVYCSYYIFGVTSFGKSCGHKQIPAAYVSLYNYIEWIEGIVWP